MFQSNPDFAPETYGTFKNNGFSESFYPIQDPPTYFNRAYALPATLSATDDVRARLFDLFRWLLAYQSSENLLNVSLNSQHVRPSALWLQTSRDGVRGLISRRTNS